MRSSDKLIRQKCPACRAEITLGSSSLNKKIQCPKCRQAVIIGGGAPVPQEPVPASHAAIRSSEFHLSRETATPVEPLPVQSRYPAQEIHSHPRDDEKEPVVYCLCNGVIKRRVISKEWGPAKNVCCMGDARCTLM